MKRKIVENREIEKIIEIQKKLKLKKIIMFCGIFVYLLMFPTFK